MRCAFTTAEIADYTWRQLEAMFPSPRPVARAPFDLAVGAALARLERCIAGIALPLYRHGDEPRFDLFHSDQYALYLAYLANALWESGGDPALQSRTFALNKALHAFNCMPDNLLPDCIVLIHLVGTVLGKAKLPNYVAVTQGVTIGAIGGIYPTLSPGLLMSPGASILGECTIGSNVNVEPNVHLLKTDVPSNVRVAGPAPHRFIPHGDRALRFFFRGGQGLPPLPLPPDPEGSVPYPG